VPQAVVPTSPSLVAVEAHGANGVGLPPLQS
jgi:hypothetical protein